MDGADGVGGVGHGWGEGKLFGAGWERLKRWGWFDDLMHGWFDD